MFSSAAGYGHHVELSGIDLLLVTDPEYPAEGRRYGEEDRWLAAELAGRGPRVRTARPHDLLDVLGDADLVLVRNSGPVAGYAATWQAFREEARQRGLRVYNELCGRGDAQGKGHLVELYAAGFPVIPTLTGAGPLDRLPPASAYVVKPLDGADSHGLQVVSADDLGEADLTGTVVQPRLDLTAEVSFHFVDDRLSHVLETRRPAGRWDLQRIRPTAAEEVFARRFLEWNDVRHGIQRVDACRTSDGQLLLVELEDLNPWLGLELLDEPGRARFVDLLVSALLRVP